MRDPANTSSASLQNLSIFSFLSRHKRGNIALASAFAAAGVIASANVQAQDTNSNDLFINQADAIHTNESIYTKSSATSQTQSLSSSSSSSSTFESSSSAPKGSSSVSVSVNGKNIAIPANGVVNQTTQTANGYTILKVNSSTTPSTTKVDLNVNSNSSSNASVNSTSYQHTVVTQAQMGDDSLTSTD